MRSARAVAAACIGLATIVAACDPLDRRYFREGIGSELYTAELPERTSLQDLYVRYICQQAGLSTLPSGEAIPFCDFSTVDRTGWMLFVQAGMNDIDQRCDGYLTWLDYKRRVSGSVLQQIQDTYTATSLIMSATGPGPKAIAIVGAAFGFAAHTFTNFNSRLLLEVDQSTVQSVVLTRQKQFRFDLPRIIDNRAAAVYALRSYLRLCMPMTIETQINTTVKLFERGGTPALETASRSPMIDARTVRTATVIGSATAPIVVPERAPRVVSETRFGGYEERLSEKQIEDFQRAVCVSQTGDLGPHGSATRVAIQRELKAPDDVLTPRKGILLRRILRDGVTCPRP